jgi:hypothetical protein
MCGLLRGADKYLGNGAAAAKPNGIVIAYPNSAIFIFPDKYFLRQLCAEKLASRYQRRVRVRIASDKEARGPKPQTNGLGLLGMINAGVCDHPPSRQRNQKPLDCLDERSGRTDADDAILFV